jgi:hypothetical protein
MIRIWVNGRVEFIVLNETPGVAILVSVVCGIVQSGSKVS